MTALEMNVEQRGGAALALCSLCLAAAADICANVAGCVFEGAIWLGGATHFVCGAAMASAPSGPQAVIGCFGLVCRGTQRGLKHPGKQQTSGCDGCYKLCLKQSRKQRCNYVTT